MYLPDYEKSSLVNFMGNILASMGAKPIYKPLENFDNSALSNSKNVVLIVIDGLGYEYLQTYGKDTFLGKNLMRKLTSVFPSTTASAITALQTGLSTLEHAMTGWFVYLKELGTASVILPFKPRYGDYSFGKMDIKAEEIFNFKNIFDKINRKSFHIIPRFILNSEFSTFVGGKAERLGYKTLQGFINQINKVIKNNDEPKFIYAYWSKFDTLSHENGTKSKKVHKHFLEIDAAISALKKTQKNNDTTIFITSDHGFLDTEKSKTLYMKDHPKLHETLILPLCGEPRVPYCYVKPSKENQFLNYINEKLKNVCHLFKSEELIEKNFFGLHYENPKLRDRIGDYILIMKDNYVFKDAVTSEEINSFIGYHGGTSKQEMFVPLIQI